MTAMFVMLVPRAVTPPSAKRRAWTTRTMETQSAPVYGPTRIAASAPPSRWPLTPGRIGKLTIWTAKMNAATRPASGTVRSSSSVRAFQTQMLSAIMAITPNITDVCALTMPSLMCMATCWTLTRRDYSAI